MSTLDYNNSQTVFQAISFLLSYPNQEWREGLNDCLELASELEDKYIASRIIDFIDEFKALDAEKQVETYVLTFDFGKKTNLYLTYMTTGEQRERGPELLELKGIYKNAGFQATDKELPDYLPLVLEFCGAANEDVVLPLLTKYQKNISEIHNNLVRDANIYAALLDCLLKVMRDQGINNI